MANNHRNSKRRRWILISVAVFVLGGSGLGIANLLRQDKTVDPSKLAAVKRGDIAQSVVATGKV